MSENQLDNPQVYSEDFQQENNYQEVNQEVMYYEADYQQQLNPQQANPQGCRHVDMNYPYNQEQIPENNYGYPQNAIDKYLTISTMKRYFVPVVVGIGATSGVVYIGVKAAEYMAQHPQVTTAIFLGAIGIAGFFQSKKQPPVQSERITPPPVVQYSEQELWCTHNGVLEVVYDVINESGSVVGLKHVNDYSELCCNNNIFLENTTPKFRYEALLTQSIPEQEATAVGNRIHFVLSKRLNQKLGSGQVRGLNTPNIWWNGKSYPSLEIASVRVNDCIAQITVVVVTEDYLRARELGTIANRNIPKFNRRDFDF